MSRKRNRFESGPAALLASALKRFIPLSKDGTSDPIARTPHGTEKKDREGKESGFQNPPSARVIITYA